MADINDVLQIARVFKSQAEADLMKDTYSKVLPTNMISFCDAVIELLKNSVPQSVVDQIRWERDTALSQLKEIGKGLGEKMDDVKPKKGHWIEMTDFDCNPYYDCSVCGVSWTMIDGTPEGNGMKYCPRCGARMDGEQE